MFLPFPSCFYEPHPALCGTPFADSCCSCCSVFDVLLGYLILFLNILLVPVYAATIVLIAHFFFSLHPASKQGDKEASK